MDALTFPLFTSVITTLISFAAAASVWTRWFQKRRAHLFAWGVGLGLYFTGALAQVVLAFGWDPLFWRLFYWCGAIAVAPWLGQGTLYLLVRRGSIARSVNGVLVIVCVMTFIWMFITPLTPPQPWPLGADMVTLTEAVMPPFSGSVRAFVPVTNAWGTLLLVGGALWSIRLFASKQILLNRVWGNVFIALGGLLPALGGYLIRIDQPEFKYVGDMVGIAFIFIGYLLATQPAPEPAAAPAAPTPVQPTA